MSSSPARRRTASSNGWCRRVRISTSAFAVVNLIPAFPLDGGKLVHLVVEERWGPRNATLIVGGLGLVFACVSTLVLIGSAISGFPIWAPPEFNINWRAFQAARHGRGGWDMYAFQG